MAAKYLVRFDDICPTMNWDRWAEIEDVLSITGIAPILAVVPDNKDSKLMVEPPHPDFWERVRAWQGRGWAIALHGYQHLYVTEDSGIIGLNARSEFAGLSADEQEKKLRAGIDVFRDEGILPDLWVAPAHSFDHTTVSILARLGITTISDGFFFAPHTDEDGVAWIPQQIWRFRSRPAGIWTVCYHHNGWKQADVNRFTRDIRRFRSDIITLDDALEVARFRRRGWLDSVTSAAMLAGIRSKTAIKGIARK